MSDKGNGVAKDKAANLTIADVHRRNMGSVTLPKELRALPVYKFTPILILSTDVNIVGW